MKTFTKMTLLCATLALWPAMQMSAQDFYDDDIYGRTAPKKAAVKKQQRDEAKGYAPADTYVPTTYGSTRSVDEYNRRGNYKPVKQSTNSADSLGQDFKYTRRIEKFHNPDIVTEVNDPEVDYYYYNDDEQADVIPTTVNIYLDSDPFWSPYYYASAWSWAYTPGYYNPWIGGYNLWGPSWSWSWGPSWSWGWGWGPSWSWGWGWNSPGWGWGPGWGHGPGWGPGHGPGWNHGPSWAGTHRPASGAWRPAARPGNVGNRPAASRPSASSGSNNRRPSASGTHTGSSTTNRSSNRGSWSRPYNPSEETRTHNTQSTSKRGSGWSSSSSTGRRSSGWNSGNSNSSSSNRSSGSWSGTRSSSSSSSTYSTPTRSYSGGSSMGTRSSGGGSTRSSGGSFGGGGSRSSGGGGGRGGRH